ncbi:MAG: carbamoyl-phosphate synthase (glutamine-hydrolyzing) small subunit [Calditrichaeota bacterium]|nr:MAG: carbamoyl-phosphate synthase (glutamine-hydrolyzing) small subunit [Calditrichota bacterium]MBL1206952.1 carbamoyl-phosphate synthase (glutamine-hydrolyzing) small subunit [Calditrichota bacterium]NOG46779.1 glutamine-hydrolyzing carbamoyl-phosphate synthase small subunit [Calditrichota bacterium]
MSQKAIVILEDGSKFEGFVFGYAGSTSGEIVFSTGMIGYTESLTDPSFYGQILTLTFPLIGNYGVGQKSDQYRLSPFESGKIQAKALIVSEYSPQFDHWNAEQSLSDWMKQEKIPGVYGIDTRSLTKHLREKGTMLGKIVIGENDVNYYDPNKENLLDRISIESPQYYGEGNKTIALLDCGCKESILKNVTEHGVRVLRLPWNWDVSSEKVDGLLISSGPGDPQNCTEIVNQIKQAISKELPTFGICLGHQVMAIAAGANTYKLKYGHRSQNQPVIKTGTNKCFITSQNHGFAVDNESLPKDWKPLFTNLNDETNEGLIHESGRFFSVQFHPEAAPGPYDTTFLFNDFLKMVK